MPIQQADTLQDIFNIESRPPGDSTVAITQKAGSVNLDYYVSGDPVTLAVVYYGPGNPKGSVTVDGIKHEIPAGMHFRSFTCSHALQLHVVADEGGAKYGWVRTK